MDGSVLGLVGIEGGGAVGSSLAGGLGFVGDDLGRLTF